MLLHIDKNLRTPTATPMFIAYQPTPTEVIMPVTGSALPTLSGMFAGLLLVVLGLAIVF